MNTAAKDESVAIFSWTPWVGHESAMGPGPRQGVLEFSTGHLAMFILDGGLATIGRKRKYAVSDLQTRGTE